ncbi:Uncharacterised protein [Mycobacterium tuberculosis]|nr:Uncharacterised protein [Mycobacterium tuberculosis]
MRPRTVRSASSRLSTRKYSLNFCSSNLARTTSTFTKDTWGGGASFSNHEAQPVRPRVNASIKL